MPFGESTAGCMVNFEHIELIHKDCIQGATRKIGDTWF